MKELEMKEFNFKLEGTITVESDRIRMVSEVSASNKLISEKCIINAAMKAVNGVINGAGRHELNNVYIVLECYNDALDAAILNMVAEENAAKNN